MQPEQQNRNQSSEPSAPAGPLSQLPYQVPDYLQLDPVTGQIPNSRNKKSILFGLGILLILLITGLGFYFWQWLQVSPEQQFYSMLDTMMQTKQIVRTYSASSATASSTATIKSDLTTLSTQIDYESKRKINTSTTLLTAVSGSILTTGDVYFYGRLSQYHFDTLPSGIQTGQWYQIQEPSSGATLAGTTGQKFDLFNLRSLLNPLYDRVITGNYDKSTRDQIVESLRTKGVYKITDHTDSIFDSHQVTVYTVTIDGLKLKDVANTLADATHTDKYDSDVASGNYKLWVDKSTDKVLKTVSIPSSSQPAATELFTYPSSATVTKPNNVEPLK